MGRVRGAPQYVCLHVPEFPAQARLRLRPEQAQKAVAILAGDPPLQQVCSLTNKAQSLGVAVGMTKAEVDTFPGLSLLPRSLAEERATQTAILTAVAAFTPRVEVCPSANAFCCVLDMAGTDLIFGDAKRSARLIADAIRAQGVVARFAVSGNFHAAVCAAPFARSGPMLIPNGEERRQLALLPVSALKLSEEQAARFELWGIKTLEELSALAEVDLVVRMGNEGKRLRELALGVHPHLMVPEEATFALEDLMEFDEPEERLEALLFVAGPMLDQLIARAQAHALSLASVTFCLLLDGGGEHVRRLKPVLPVADRGVLLKLLNLDLQAHPPSTGVIGVRIAAEPGKRGKVQMGLFSPQLPESTRLDVTLAQIEALVGEGRVGSPRLLDTHHPEDFTMERFAIPAKAPANPARTISVALRRIRPPLVLGVWLDATLKPASFFYEGQRFSVEQAYGPWRQSAEWWSERVWSREEWDVRATSGDRTLMCVLVYDLLHRHWQMEGFYD